MAAVPSWAEMMGRAMAMSFDTAIGTMTWSDPDEEPPAHTGTIRFWYARPDHWRIEDELGAFIISGPGGTFVRRAPGAMTQMPGDGHVGMPQDPRHLVDGREVARSLSEPNDFSRPMGPAVATEVGGRLGWRFVLAPPPHKPAPLEVVLDDVTGVVLEYRSQGAAYWETLTAFEENVEVDDALFLWDGVIDTEWVDQRLLREERARAVADFAWPSPRWWPTGMPLDVIEGDVQEGWFMAWLGEDRGRSRMLARWRPGAPPQLLDAYAERMSFRQRWEREGWEWLLATDEEIAPDDLRRIIDSIPPA